ncbi:MAG: DEAD/DEAH box helicase [Planctomycetota bacterium]
MDVEAFLSDVRSSPEYAGQAVYVRDVDAREAKFGDPARPFAEPVRAMLEARGIERVYSHQAKAIDAARDGKNVLIATGTASGKSICYVVPIIEMLLAEPDGKFLLLFPTKALSQDQFKNFRNALNAAGLDDVLAGVYDGDTPSAMRRKLRDHGSVIFSNPDMLHSALMPEHGRWANFIAKLKILVIDEVHVYNGIFGSNAANLFRRFFRICAHYQGGQESSRLSRRSEDGHPPPLRTGADGREEDSVGRAFLPAKARPQVIGCSATIGNPKELGERLIGDEMVLVDEDGSPRGKRTYVFWNPPKVRKGHWRSRRSANVEAHELMAMLVQRGVPTITFSKAKMTAEMIHRYVTEKLRQIAPQLAKKVSPYRGGYRPEERREIERRLFSGELLGVSTTRALELGIDVGGLDASIIVGYPGTLASFFQQSGRAGRQDRDALIVLVGLDTAVNQYVMTEPEYIFGRPLEQGVIDPDNPFVVTGHLRCGTHELPVADDETETFGPYAGLVLKVLEENLKVNHIDNTWYHAAPETPQHEVSLRNYADANVLIQDVDTGAMLGEVNKFDAPPILHKGAIYMHMGDTYEVLELELDRRLATVRKVKVDYYTQPLGGTDIHHVDEQLREKPFGAGMVYWGEVTAYFNTNAFEKIHFYSLDALSVHPVELPTQVLETMAFWIVPPEDLMEKVRLADLDAHAGLRSIGYATRMLLPLYITCDTLDFSHTIGSANSPWNAIFVYERYPHGLGFTEKAYELMDRIAPAVFEHVKSCPCEEGCPCCTGKPLRQYATWSVDRGEASIPSKAVALMILEGLLGDGTNLINPDTHAMTDSVEGEFMRLEQSLRRRLERMREPQVFHPIEPKIKTQYPDATPEEKLGEADVAGRKKKRRSFERKLRDRIAKKIETDELSPYAGAPGPPPGTRKRHYTRRPDDFAGKPETGEEKVADGAPPKPERIIKLGDSIASRARKLRRNRS